MITSAEVDEDLLKMKVGLVCHSRWLTTANRYCRLYVANHGLTGNDARHLHAIVSFIVSHYFPLWFDIKAESSLTSGPSHILKEIEIVRQMKGKDATSKTIKKIAMKFIEKGAWSAHSEPLLLSLLASNEEEDRRFAISKILEIRNGADFGDTSVRQVVTPNLNWDAKSLRHLQNFESLTESNVTSSISSKDLWDFLEKPLELGKIPCHAQSWERCVKEVTIASAAVFGAERRDGYIRAKIESRSVLPVNETKKDLASLIPT